MGTGAQFLVTGGTGFIGRFVVRNLLHNSARVRLLCRDEDKARRLFGKQIETVSGNLLDSTSCQRACRDVQTVIHIGGSYRFGRRYRFVLEATNHRGSENILQAAADHRVTRFVHVSSASVLESRDGPITERDVPGHISRRQSYRRSKWLSECAALAWAQRGLPVVIVNPTAPLGPDDETPTPTGQMVLDFLQGRFPFSAHTTINILHVAELAEGILAAASRGRNGERYLLGHHDLSLAAFLRVLAQCTGQSAPHFRLPWGVIALAGACGEIAGASRVCWETAAHARKRAFVSCQKAADELGWRPTRPLELTVRESVTWFRQRVATPALTANDLSKTNVANS
jgi:dihydroflavonol-4-reductase